MYVLLYTLNHCLKINCMINGRGCMHTVSLIVIKQMHYKTEGFFIYSNCNNTFIVLNIHLLTNSKAPNATKQRSIYSLNQKY